MQVREDADIAITESIVATMGDSLNSFEGLNFYINDVENPKFTSNIDNMNIPQVGH